MKPGLVLVLALATTVTPSSAQPSALDYPSVWHCDNAKFNWYCDSDEEPASATRPPPPAPQPKRDQVVAPRRTETRDLRTAEQIRLELKRREDAAVMDPSEQNIKNYLELWQIVQEKGAVFADSWRRVVWSTPELDYSLRRPTNNAAIKQYDSRRVADEEQQLRNLAKDHGLIFFFRSDCPYCHAMAPILKTLTQKYGIEVLGVSIDGGSLPDFPAPNDGRGLAAGWGIERVPALFIGSKQTGDKAPIGFGAMALTDIVQRIFVLTGTRPGENF